MLVVNVPAESLVSYYFRYEIVAVPDLMTDLPPVPALPSVKGSPGSNKLSPEAEGQPIILYNLGLPTFKTILPPSPWIDLDVTHVSVFSQLSILSRYHEFEFLRNVVMDYARSSMVNNFRVDHPQSTPQMGGMFLVHFHGIWSSDLPGDFSQCLDHVALIFNTANIKYFPVGGHGAATENGIEGLLDGMEADPRFPAALEHISLSSIIFLAPAAVDPIIYWGGTERIRNAFNIIDYSAQDLRRAMDEVGDESDVIVHTKRMLGWFNESKNHKAFRTRFKGCDRKNHLIAGSATRFENNVVVVRFSCRDPCIMKFTHSYEMRSYGGAYFLNFSQQC